MQAMRVKRLASWATNGGTLEIVEKSGHVIHANDPQRVIATVQRLLELVGQ